MEALRAGQRPDLATTAARGPSMNWWPCTMNWACWPRAIPWRWSASARASPTTCPGLPGLATLPFVEAAAPRAAAEALFREPAILLPLGWAPAPIRAGDNARHRHPAGRQPESVPCHPDTRRDEPRRVGEAAWERAHRAGVGALYARGLVRGKVYAIDGTGLGADPRVVALVCVRGVRPLIVAWRLWTGSASEKGKAAAVTRALVVLYVGGVYGVFALDEVLAELGVAVREGLLPRPAVPGVRAPRQRLPPSPDPPSAAA